MSIDTELARILGAVNTLKTKGKSFGIITEEESQSLKIDGVAEKFDSVENRGNISAEVKEGETYTIPAGYHSGAGTVTGVIGGGNYKLQSKTATPTKKQQRITPDAGNYGLSDVTVEPIPQNFQDVTPVTVVAEDILATKIAVGADGSIITGTMLNNGTVSEKLTTESASYNIPKGYHDGEGNVSIDLEDKSVTPKTEPQVVSPTTGKVLKKVTVEAIPSQYKDTTDANASADQILQDATAYVKGEKIVGAMPDNGAVDKTLTGSETSYTIPAGYHNGEGNIKIITETKSATPTKLQQQITPTSGKVLTQVTVEAIPENYIDTSEATATSEDILNEKTAYVNGEKISGTMVNNGTINEELTSSKTSYVIPKGYHSGEGTISVDLETKDITPTKELQSITPAEGKLISSVTVQAIPAEYVTTTDANALATDILATKTAYVNGVKITGSMANNGSFSQTIDGLTTTEYTIPAGYHDGTGKISLTNDIETRLAAI